MTNQAAQTMPTVPQAFFDEFGVNADDRVMDYGRACYAAALSQTAGVVVSDEMIERACKDYAFRVDGALWPDAYDEHEVLALRAQMREFLLNAIGAAPSASGIHPDALPDGTLSKSTAKRVEALGASGGEGPTLHPATEDLIRRFSDALREKLSAAEKKYGYSDGWASPDWMDQCRRHLDQHVAKGDPRDVAAYCAFLWHHGEPTTKRDRDADRKRFPDDDFNAWLDAGISDAGHTVYDSLSSIEDAWQGWHGHVLSVMIDENPVFDDLAIDCPPVRRVGE